MGVTGPEGNKLIDIVVFYPIKVMMTARRSNLKARQARVSCSNTTSDLTEKKRTMVT